MGSGGLVLGAEIVLRMGTNPTQADEALLYGTCAGATARLRACSSWHMRRLAEVPTHQRRRSKVDRTASELQTPAASLFVI